MKQICVIGLGYIGLPTALMMASRGLPVTGVDYNRELVNTLRKGITTFEEDGIEELFQKALDGGIRFSDEYIPADMYIVAVPTPYDKFTKKIATKYVDAAVRDILKICPPEAIIVIESTISPGTIERYIRPLVKEVETAFGKDVRLVHAPERIIPGSMIYELENNSRVIGADDQETGLRVKEAYSAFCRGEIVVTDIRTAEMTKVVENTFRDINIAFANELCKICRQDDMDVYKIIRIANMHPRVNILQPGPGVGGHCISVDPWFLVGDYPGLSLLIHEARKINDSMPEFVLERIHFIMKEKGLSNPARVGLYGLTYKDNVDDTRESPTLQLLECVERHMGVPLRVYDPIIKADLVPNQCHSFEEFLEGADIIVLMAAHEHILKNMDKLKSKIVLDTRHVCTLPETYYL